MKYFNLLLAVLLVSCSSQTVPTAHQPTIEKTTSDTEEVKEKQEIKIVETHTKS